MSAARKIEIVLILAVIMLGLGCANKGEIIAAKVFVASADSSVFAQTRARYEIEYDSLDLGMIVTAIDGVRHTKTAFWLYSVNGEPANIACNEYLPSAGDTVEWRLMSVY